MNYTRKIEAVFLGMLVVAISELNQTSQAHEDFTIVPGNRVGIVKLGMFPDKVTIALGKRDGSYSLPRDQRVEYSEWKDSSRNLIIKLFYDESDHVVQIAAAAPKLATKDGISVNSDLTAVKCKYKHLERSQYKSKNRTIDYYDDVKRGIAFEFVGDSSKDEPGSRIAQILVHLPGQAVISDIDELPLSTDLH